MPVSDQHKLYSHNINKWRLVRDCVDGSSSIKNSRESESGNTNNGLFNIAGSRYLPPPNPRDSSQDNLDRYHAYKTRANFVNFTGHTKDGFMGMIGRKQPEIELVTNIDYLEDNANGGGLELDQLLQQVISELLETGRNGILVDFPQSDGGTLSQTSNLQAFLIEYQAESIKNWRETVINGCKTLSLIVLAEQQEKILEDGFSTEMVTYHRVLFLDDGVYKQNLYNEDDELLLFVDENGEPNPDIIPRKFDGTTWDVIPFQFFGSMNNDTNPDKAPLYDLAEVNIAHYRNSADFEESSFIVGQPTPVISGLTQAWVDDVMKGGLLLGSRSAILLPADASASLLQANSNQMPQVGMELKEQQMVKIGAKVITDSGGVETAEAAKIRFAGQNSKLGLIVSNVQQGFESLFKWAVEFMGGTGESRLEINKQFYDATVNPQLLVAQMQLMDRGVIAKSDLRSTMRKQSLIGTDRTDDDIDEEVGSIDPMV